MEKEKAAYSSLFMVFCGRTLSPCNLILLPVVTIDTNSTLAVECDVWDI